MSEPATIKTSSPTPWSALTGRWGLVLTLIGILLFVIWFGNLAVSYHNAWFTQGYDLGNADQALWNTAQGRPLQFTNWLGKDDWFKAPSRLAMHVEPIYILLAPLYWLWDDVRALLILQVVIVGLGALPAYRMSRRILASEIAGVVFAAVYLLSIGIHWLVIDDFHAVSLAAPFLLAAYDFLEEHRNTPFLIFAILAMMTKENVPLAVAGMGMWAWWAQKRRRFGLAVISFSMLWFILAVFAVIPLYNRGGSSPYFEYYKDLPTTEIFRIVFERFFGRTAWQYYFDYLRNVAFLPLLSPLAMIPALPDLAINLLSDNPAMHQFGRQYVAVLVPISIAAAILGLAKLWRWLDVRATTWSRYLRSATLLILFGCALIPTRELRVTPFWGDYWKVEVTEHKLKLGVFADLIPAEGSLCTPDNLNPHFTHRQQIHILPFTLDCDYILLDVLSAPFLGPNSDGAHDTWRELLLEQGNFGVISGDDGIMLLKRNAPPGPLPADFFSFAQPGSVEPEVERRGIFGEQIEWLGYDIEQRNSQPPLVHFYFKTLADLEDDHFLRLYLIREAGTILAASERVQPTLVWYPTSAWSPDQVVEITADTMDWEVDLDPNQVYALALGWDNNTDAWSTETRLLYNDGADAVAPRRFQDDSLIYVTSFAGSGETQLDRRQTALADEAYPINARLGDTIQLEGFAVHAPDESSSFRPGDQINLRLFWLAEQDIAQDYTVLVHLLDDSGNVVAQGDAPPLGNSWPTSRWQAGDRISDFHIIATEPDLPEGQYSLAIGLYDPISVINLPVQGNGADPASKRITLPLSLKFER
ncbi:MAG: DUF2079 domain-containing protein [Chloroflexi bacterium]|nr:DUF2079 domain-containing protein [Chloroflexota bacterium]